MSDIKPWEERSREPVFSKYGRGMEKRTYRLPHGQEADFYLSTGHESIACVALTEDNQVILVRQFRPGPGQILLELPGGGLNPSEKLEEAMARELLEETGYQAGQVVHVATVLPSAYATYRKNALVATDCHKVAEPKLEDNGEMVEAVLMSVEAFRVHLRSGALTDVEIGYLGLDHLGLLKG